MNMKTRFLAGAVAALLLAATPAAFAEDESPNIVCHKANGIVIDGDLSDWDLSSPAVVEDASQVIRDVSFWQGTNDCSMKVYTAYDETNLYLGFDVTEDSIYGAIDMLPVDGEDNLKIFLSTDPSSDPARTSFVTNDFLVYLIMNEGYWDTAIDRSMLDKDTRQRFVSIGMDGGESAIEGYELATQSSTTGFIFECIIPWAALSNKKIPVYVPTSGDTLSVDFAITDISYPCPGTEYIPQMAWTGDSNINTNPSLWGSMTME